MNRSRRQKCNEVNAASLARWIVMTAFLALAGLGYVYLTLQLYHLGERRKAIESELVSLRTQNDIASAQIAAFTSRSALQRRLKERLQANHLRRARRDSRRQSGSSRAQHPSRNDSGRRQPSQQLGSGHCSPTQRAWYSARAAYRKIRQRTPLHRN